MGFGASEVCGVRGLAVRFKVSGLGFQGFRVGFKVWVGVQSLRFFRV